MIDEPLFQLQLGSPCSIRMGYLATLLSKHRSDCNPRGHMSFARSWPWNFRKFNLMMLISPRKASRIPTAHASNAIKSLRKVLQKLLAPTTEEEIFQAAVGSMGPKDRVKSWAGSLKDLGVRGSSLIRNNRINRPVRAVVACHLQRSFPLFKKDVDKRYVI